MFVCLLVVRKVKVVFVEGREGEWGLGPRLRGIFCIGISGGRDGTWKEYLDALPKVPYCTGNKQRKSKGKYILSWISLSQFLFISQTGP
jgi:hypothetical protein